MEDPLPVIENLYPKAYFWSDELRQRFEMTEQQNPMGKYGSHRYRIQDFGITLKDIDRHTEHYQIFYLKCE